MQERFLLRKGRLFCARTNTFVVVLMFMPCSSWECQIKAWKEGHKKGCKVITAVKWFTDKDWEKFEGWWDRRIPQQRAPKPMMTSYKMGDNGQLEPI